MQNPQNRHANSTGQRQNSRKDRAIFNADSRHYVDGQELESVRYFRNHERALDGSDDTDSQTPMAERSLSAGRGGYDYDEGKYSEPAFGENAREDYGSIPPNQNTLGSGSNYGSTYSTGSNYGSERFGKRWRDDDKNYNVDPRVSHSGKGPKNYQRSDARILEDVNEALTHHDEVDASDIEVLVNDGLVILSGTVPARAMKNAAEDLVVCVSGVKDVKNQITSSRFLARIFHR
jgi:hypothetical protein